MKLHKSLTLDVLMQAAESEMFGLENPGFCVQCGAEHGGCEPDARKYPCDNCEQNSVYGAQELLMDLFLERLADELGLELNQE